ncbi:MAG: transporter permease, partial [Conexibacter sp.]|nr:transporter permease [Conexibacter sp.]
EAIITAQIGAVIGLVLGIVLSVLVTRAIDDFSLSIPVITLILLLIGAAIAGVFAAILPARRASRLNVLESLAYE